MPNRRSTPVNTIRNLGTFWTVTRMDQLPKGGGG